MRWEVEFRHDKAHLGTRLDEAEIWIQAHEAIEEMLTVLAGNIVGEKEGFQSGMTQALIHQVVDIAIPSSGSTTVPHIEEQLHTSPHVVDHQLQSLASCCVEHTLQLPPPSKRILVQDGYQRG